MLSHDVGVGVQELDQEKLTPLLRLKYNNSIADAVAHLGKPEDIGRVRLVVAVWAERSLPMADLKGRPKTT